MAYTCFNMLIHTLRIGTAHLECIIDPYRVNGNLITLVCHFDLQRYKLRVHREINYCEIEQLEMRKIRNKIKYCI